MNRTLNRLWEAAKAVSIRVKVLGIVLGAILLLGVVVIIQMRAVVGRELTHDLEHQGTALVEDIASYVRETIDQPAAIPAILADRQAHYSNTSHNTQVVYLALDEADGTPIAETGTSGLDVPSRSQSAPADRDIYVESGGGMLHYTTLVPETRWRLYVGLSQALIARTVDDVTWQLVTITLAVAALGFAGAYFVSGILTAPIRDLVTAAHAVAKGDLSRRVPRWADDEIGELAVAFNDMTAALGQAAAERGERERLREQYVSDVIRAQESERQRIARELHDSTGQSLTSLLVGLQNLKREWENGDAECRIDQLREMTTGALEEVREMSRRLRPSVLDDMGLQSALEHYVDAYQRHHGVQVDFVMRGVEGRLQPDMETAVYRIVQEGLTNVARYARAQTASVFIGQRDRLLRILIEDDGVGFDVDDALRAGGLGLRGMRERARLFGGEMQVQSNPGAGTTLVIEIPLPAKETV